MIRQRGGAAVGISCRELVDQEMVLPDRGLCNGLPDHKKTATTSSGQYGHAATLTLILNRP